MVALLKVKKAGVVPSSFRKAWRAQVKAQWHETGMLWHSRYRDKHFTAAGAREYKYTRRKGELQKGNPKRYASTYTGRKEKRFGHTLPNVYSGLMRRMARVVDVRASSKGVRIPLSVRVRVIRNSRVNQLREMTAVSEREVYVLVKVFDRRMRQRLADFRQRSEYKARG